MFLQFLQSTAQDWARKSSRSILNAVYAMEVVPVGGRTPVKVRDLPLSAHITKIIESPEARSVLSVPEGWLETLGLMLHPPAMESIFRAADDTRAGRVVGLRTPGSRLPPSWYSRRGPNGARGKGRF